LIAPPGSATNSRGIKAMQLVSRRLDTIGASLGPKTSHQVGRSVGACEQAGI
jgi:hypothetical protein